MMKLKPCTILLWASDDNVTNVSTPTTAPASLTAGPPLLPHAADASVWITSWSARSCLNPETAPPVTDASILADEFSSSWLRTTPGKPTMWSRSPMCACAAADQHVTADFGDDEGRRRLRTQQRLLKGERRLCRRQCGSEQQDERADETAHEGDCNGKGKAPGGCPPGALMFQTAGVTSSPPELPRPWSSLSSYHPSRTPPQPPSRG